VEDQADADRDENVPRRPFSGMVPVRFHFERVFLVFLDGPILRRGKA